MSTTDPNNDNLDSNQQFNFLNEEQESDSSSEEFITPTDSELPTATSDLEDDSSDSSDIVPEELSTDVSDDASSDSSDVYAPLEGEEEYSEDSSATADESVEEERKEVYHPPVMNRYNTILLITLLMLTVGVVLMLLRLADYKFNVKAKQTDDGFGAIQYTIPADADNLSVVRKA